MTPITRLYYFIKGDSLLPKIGGVMMKTEVERIINNINKAT